MQVSETINNKELYDIIVLGGGLTGLAAALTGGRLGFKTLLLEKAVFGGCVAVLDTVTEYPGIEKTDGWELTQTIVKQAEMLGCRLLDSTEAGDVRESEDNSFEVVCSNGKRFKGRSVIIATGGEPLMLELADEAHFARHGIHTCVQCSGTRYKGETVAIAGNNSWALRAAAHLLKLGCTVLYITGDTELFGDAGIVNNLLNHEQFRFLGGCHVTGLYGKEDLEEILVAGLAGGSFQKIKVSAVFVYRGIKPNSGMVRARKDRKGFLQVDENSMTSIPGIFAAGRVVHPVLPIEVMAGDGSRATLGAAGWLRGEA
ncbi:MAG: FAD-dependent oxidoreductase [Deltaproteobacteria bacterium]|jgi:thioredoxin reductase (NADPH)|nr:FAD-dependent oxidoreductase [Deltaproteobacteria bacterium]